MTTTVEPARLVHMQRLTAADSRGRDLVHGVIEGLNRSLCNTLSVWQPVAGSLDPDARQQVLWPVDAPVMTCKSCIKAMEMLLRRILPELSSPDMETVLTQVLTLHPYTNGHHPG